MAGELRPQPVPRPKPGSGLTADQLPGEGRLPFKTGSVHMTPMAEASLRSVGWKPGDPIPGDLGQRLKEIQAEVLQEKAGADLENDPRAAGWEPVQSSFVKIEDLPPDKQQEIARYLKEYKQEVAQQKQNEAALEAIDASIPDNVQGEQRDLMRNQLIAGEQAQLAREARRATQQTGVDSVVIDDRKPAGPPPGMAVPEGKQFAGSLGRTLVANKLAAAQELQNQHEQGQREQPHVHQEEAPAAGGVMAHANCPRCSWPTDKPFEIEPTNEDKQGFIAAVLGMGRFTKKYELLGGNLELYFRSLSSDESAMLQQQLGRSVRDGEIRGDGEYWANMLEFRMVMAISKIVTGGNTIYEAEPVKEWAASHPPAAGAAEQYTPLPQMRANFYEVGVKQEPLRRIIGQQHQSFQRLVEGLEAMMDSPDFWKGIGPLA